MQIKKKTVALVEPAAGNVDPVSQKAILARYANKHRLDVDLVIGEWSPSLGTAGEPEHRNLLNDIRDGGVGRLLVLADVRHAVPDNVLAECRKAGVKVDFIDVLQERGLA
ncbi:MAG TPA: hypothetical protein VLM38_18780 [Blastocatellia bacterium]|nr:hypothetical protein [Blastocatellia bacterium]